MASTLLHFKLHKFALRKLANEPMYIKEYTYTELSSTCDILTECKYSMFSVKSALNLSLFI